MVATLLGSACSVREKPRISTIYLIINMENIMSEAKKCGCGRSTTGFCIGWHSLTNEQYLAKLNEQKINESKQQLNG